MEENILVNQKYRWNSTRTQFVAPPDLSPISNLPVGVVVLLLE